MNRLQVTSCDDRRDVAGPVIYFCYDCSEQLLYIGCTMADLPTRCSSHRSSKSWWPDVVRIDLVTVPFDLLTARWAEAELIATLEPRHNIEHTRRARRQFIYVQKQHATRFPPQQWREDRRLAATP